MASKCIKAKDDSILLKKDEILERWTEYIKELFEDNRNTIPRISKDISGPKIMADETRKAIRSMKRNKSCGPDLITAEMLQATEDFSVDKITLIANNIYDTGEFPNELMQSIFHRNSKEARCKRM